MLSTATVATTNMANSFSSHMPRLLLVITSTLTFLLNDVIMAEPTLSFSAPVNPVKENGILSLHCLVSDLQVGYEVTISRQIGNNYTQTMTWSGLVTVENDPRIFLAVRQLSGGDVVHFLSIVGAKRSDEGVYTCKVLKSGRLNTVAEDTTSIHFQYFPAEPPGCMSDNVPLSVYAGTPVSLNCSSESAYPAVHITWSRTGGKDIPSKSVITSRNIVHNSVVFRPSLRDDGVIFFCKVTSPAFPSEMNTCHIGPLKVIPNPYEDYIDSDFATTLPKSLPEADNDIDSNKDLPDGNTAKEDTLQCRDICRLQSSSSLFYWIIAAFLAGIVAFTFCIVAVMIAFRLHRAKRAMTLHRMATRPHYHHQTHQDIYLELDDKFDNDNNRVYMALDQCRKVYHPNMETMGTYTSTPVAPKGPII